MEYYCLDKKKSVLRGVQHLVQLILNTILIYYYYGKQYSLYYYFSYQFQLICSVYYHFSSDFYKYNVEHEKILQKWDHLGINVAILVGTWTIYHRLDLQSIFILHLFIVILVYYLTKHLDMTAFINLGCVTFILPWYLVTLSTLQIILLLFATKFAAIGIMFYLDKSYKYYVNNVYLFGHHELYHLFTAVAVYILLYIQN